MRNEIVGGDMCIRCTSRIDKDQKVCNYCGKPTQFMTFEERTAYEVAQYRAWRESTAATA